MFVLAVLPYLIEGRARTPRLKSLFQGKHEQPRALLPVVGVFDGPDHAGDSSWRFGHGEDPGVFKAEVGFKQTLLPGVPIQGNLFAERAFKEVGSFDRHGGAVNLQEEKGLIPVRRIVREKEAKNLVRNEAKPVLFFLAGSLVFKGFDYWPGKGVIFLGLAFGHRFKDLARVDQFDFFRVPAGQFQADHEVGRGQGMLQEDGFYFPVFAGPVYAGPGQIESLGEIVRPLVAYAVDHGVAAGGVGLYLFPGPVEIAGMIEKLEAS